MSRQGADAEPMPWLTTWGTDVIEPLADDQLSLTQLAGQAPGELWLQPRAGGPRLVYRAQLDREEGAWRLEAQLGLTASEHESLARALGKSTDEQPLSGAMLDQLGGHRVAVLNLVPMAVIPAERIVASLGAPRLRLRTGEGEAWIYPRQGLSVHLLDDQVQLLHLVPREAMKH
jgi:hypothetical protein